jgi:hypothetical protein
MPDHEAQSFEDDAYHFTPEPPQELLMEIARRLLPQPDLLPLLAEAFGENSGHYIATENVIYGQPANTDEDFHRYHQVLDALEPLLRTLPPLREVVPDPDAD